MKALTVLSLCFGSAVATAVAGVSAPAAPASGGWVGDFNVRLEASRLNGSPVSGSEEDQFESAYTEIQLGRDFGQYFVQADIFGEATDVGSSNGSYAHGFGGALHVVRDFSFGDLGAFFGAYTADHDNDSTDDAYRYFGGIESRLDRSEADYYLQVGYLFPGGGSDSDALNRAYFTRVVALRELTNTLSLAGELGYAQGEVDGDDTSIITAGIALNQQISESLVASLSYDFIKYDQSGENDVIREHIVGLSLTYSFGSGSSATSLGTPRLMRWSGITGGQLE